MSRVVARVAPWLLAAAIPWWVGCPTTPNDADHAGAADAECIACHMVEGEGPSPPQDHWDGDGAASGRDSCTHCHRPGR